MLLAVCTFIMVTTPLRSLVLLLSLAPASLLGCATDEDVVEDLGDVDGSGKGDGATSTDPTRLVDVPFYFAVPKTTVTAPIDRARYPYPTLWNGSLQSADLGLRVIAIQQGAGVSAKQAARRDMAARLGRAGVLQDGDIVLTFRPELAGTMAYPHIQMGTTHAGLVYTQNGVAFNIDSPLDGQYVGQFDTAHYAGDGAQDAGTDALHIVRPRITDARRVQLRDWVGTLKRNLARINGARQQVKFQSDYLIPSYVASGMTTRQTVTLLGRIILEADTTTKLPMYCSEFAWHMLALSNCTATEIRNAPAGGAACVDEVFAPMPLVAKDATELGMAEGPLLALMKLPAASRAVQVPKIFATGDAAKLSSGHRAVSDQVAPLMAPLQELYQARAGGAPLEATADVAAALSANMPNNYSPTTFLVQAMSESPTRPMDYVATLAFVNAAGYQKAQRLAQQPVP
ncbi:MAG: hypothetical protein M3680_07290 [Myxococcota bacterium]|nr:hypothetical protein [Myxococcota bacterium]